MVIEFMGINGDLVGFNGIQRWLMMVNDGD